MSVSPDQSLSAFLDAVAARQPTPGGGAVAAVAGALAAAIGEMAIQYSIGRKATPQFDGTLTHVLSELSRARLMMLELIIEDQLAFAELTDAKKLAIDDPERSARVTSSVAACIAVPRAIAGTALSILRVVEPMVEMTNQWLVSDLAVCVELSMATVRAAQWSVRANLSEVANDQRVTLIRECDNQIARGVRLTNKTLARLKTLS